MDIRLVDATEQDVPLIVRLIKDLARYEKLEHEVVATEESVRDSLFVKRAAETVLAYADGEPAGYAMFFQTFSTFKGLPGMYLEDLYVEERFRGHGIGRLLLTHLARIAVARGCGRMDWAVLDWNAPAIGFYKTLGAAPVDDWTIFRLKGEPLRKLAEKNV
jgi:GNAT superfamily N-acetyltransferase